jgi:flagellin
MSLRINHNLAALNANRNLKLTTESLTKSMQKLSSGFRINAAADDPAGLVISEQFRSQIAGLNRAIQNSEGSITMIQTAEGALTEINNLLISMRELAIHAANEGFNDDDQLAADQAEIANALKTIDRIAANTQFGTKKILDGSKDNIATITSADTSGVSIMRSNLSTGQHSITATKTAESSAKLNTTSLGISLTNTDGDPYNLTEKIHNIDVVQASDVAKKVSGSFDLTDAWGNSLHLNATGATAATMTSSAGVATIGMDTGGVATAGDAGTYQVVVNYQENGESPSGNQTIQFDVAAGDKTADIAASLQAAINTNTALAGKVTVTATSGVEQASLFIQSANVGAQYSFRLESVTNTTGTAQAFDISAGSARGTSDNLLGFDVVTAQWSGGRTGVATVAAGDYTSNSQLVDAINTALRTDASGNGGFGTIAGGATTNDITASVVNTNQIQFATRDEGSDYSIKLDAGVDSTGNLMNVLNLTADTLPNQGTDALVAFDNYTNTITAVKYATEGAATLYSAAADKPTRGSVDITLDTALNGINLGNLLLDVKAAKFDVRLDGGPATSVTAGVDTNVFNADRSESLIVSYGLTSNGGTETINNFNQSLVFQIGANVGQTAEIGIRNMSASALGTNLAGNMFRSLAEIDVTTVQGAQDAQSIIDASIDEVSTTRGTLGSFQKNTLESNLRNLRIAAQNMTASESIIRDADMAEEMSEFTKNQILVQTGTAMLAQSNQIPQVILSLF